MKNTILALLFIACVVSMTSARIPPSGKCYYWKRCSIWRPCGWGKYCDFRYGHHGYCCSQYHGGHGHHYGYYGGNGGYSF
ncbi:uncharacterized protein LOC128170149 [Crassostrea angulata]|uniref:uncharacterized protein LOC128170149 n=1 Tax=Magallana angulata TaxID=2784310 RepID=UPI0022B0F96B|nr:uncharacterized protein LOC128170149 [Crassostrea angulata]